MNIQSVKWTGDIPDGVVDLIDQTRLPDELIILKRDNYIDIAEDIKRLAVRGAPAISIAGAFGAVLGIQKSKAENYTDFENEFQHVTDVLKKTRHTAVNLFHAIDRMHKTCASNSNRPVPEIKQYLLKEAKSILKEDIELCGRIGLHGQEIIKNNSAILTHCNTGALAAGGAGTAISIIYHAHKAGKKIKVFAGETRPLLQGGRLTAWELLQYGIDVTLICDSAAGLVMKQGMIDCVITGADRIARNGDTANKIGTYALSVLAKAHEIPFYIAAPFTTFDPECENGNFIIIEERAKIEVTEYYGKRIAPESVNVYNPAFDITPAENITAFVTDKGLIYPPFGKNIKMVFGR